MNKATGARVTLARSVSRGTFAFNGAEAFASRFSSEKSLNDFVAWRDHPVTRLYLGALRALAFTPPPMYISKDSVEVQYGMQSGVELAAMLADDPTSIYPDMFTGATSGAGGEMQADPDYAVPPDSAE